MSLRTLVFSGLAVAVIAIGGTLAFSPWNAPGHAQVQTSQAQPEAPPPAAAPRTVPTSQPQVQLSFAPIVQAVSPSVVNVYATRIESQATSPFANDPFFSRFFGRDFQTRPR